MATEAVIAGIGETSFGDLPDLSEVGICVEAASAAVADAGVDWNDIDGLILQPPFHASPRFHMLVGEALGLFVKTFTESTSMGGASYGANLQVAKWAVESGLCKNVLLVAGEKAILREEQVLVSPLPGRYAVLGFQLQRL